MNVIFCGDLRQLPPVSARSIFKPLKNSLSGALLWQSLKYYSLTTVMRQSDVLFSNILTKIGDGKELTTDEATFIENRFRTEQWCKENCPQAIRLFHKNCDVEQYNLESITNFITCQCKDTFEGYNNNQELTSARTKLHTLNVTECGGMPYMLRLCLNKPYMVTCNIDVEDGIVNGAIGITKYFEYDEDDSNNIIRIWIKFENDDIGSRLRMKSRPLIAGRPGVLSPDWSPLTKTHAKISITNRIKCTRIQFPLVAATSLTIHKSQGGSFDEIVYKYHKSQDQQLVYVALSLNVRTWLLYNCGKVMDTPAQSPDLNPIENLWAFLKKKVAKRHPKNKEGLKRAIIEEWQSLPSYYDFKKLIYSMKKRLQCVIDSKGGHTKY